MSAVPGVPGGLVAVMAVVPVTVKRAGMLPNLTPVAPVKPVPVMVTGVPPDAGPETGEIPVTAGGTARPEILIIAGTCCPSIPAMTIAVPPDDGVKSVCDIPDTVPAGPGDTDPGPETTVNETGIASGT